MFQLQTVDAIIAFGHSKHRSAAGVGGILNSSMDDLSTSQTNQAAELLPSLLSSSAGAGAGGGPAAVSERRQRRCKTAPSGGLLAAVEEPEVGEGGCLPFGFSGLGLSRWRRTKKCATVDFANQVIPGHPSLRNSSVIGAERRPRSILRRPSQDLRGGSSEEEAAARAARRARSRVRFSSTVSVAKVSIVKIKDESPKRPRRRSKSCEGSAEADAAVLALRSSNFKQRSVATSAEAEEDLLSSAVEVSL